MRLYQRFYDTVTGGYRLRLIVPGTGPGTVREYDQFFAAPRPLPHLMVPVERRVRDRFTNDNLLIAREEMEYEVENYGTNGARELGLVRDLEYVSQWTINEEVPPLQAPRKRNGARTLEQAVRYCRIYAPELFPSRASVLDHIFCKGPKNGWIWADGFYIHQSRFGRSRSRDVNDAQNKAWEISVSEKPVLFKMEDSTYTQFARLFRDKGDFSDPYWRECNLFCIEANVQKDWLDGAYETLQLILSRNPEIGHNARNIEEAKKLIDTLDRTNYHCRPAVKVDENALSKKMKGFDTSTFIITTSSSSVGGWRVRG